ncbi:hypothetical protein C0J52_05569 [Blattella germanica]|nr:hypothetical protein C0J52_05569 [Blattella germanica]
MNVGKYKKAQSVAICGNDSYQDIPVNGTNMIQNFTVLSFTTAIIKVGIVLICINNFNCFVPTLICHTQHQHVTHTVKRARDVSGTISHSTLQHILLMDLLGTVQQIYTAIYVPALLDCNANLASALRNKETHPNGMIIL